METSMPGGDMPQLASDHERKLVVGEMLDPVAREHERVRLPEAESNDGHVVVFAYEDKRHGDLERRTGPFNDRKDARILPFVHPDARTEQSTPRQCHVQHRDHDEKRYL